MAVLDSLTTRSSSPTETLLTISTQETVYTCNLWRYYLRNYGLTPQHSWDFRSYEVFFGVGWCLLPTFRVNVSVPSSRVEQFKKNARAGGCVNILGQDIAAQILLQP